MKVTIASAASTAPAPELSKVPGRRMFIKSYGCQMNVYDAERMQDLLGPYGYTLVDDILQAELVIFNTCHIREKADEKLFSDIGRLTKRHKGNPLIAVGGCIGQALGRKVMQRSPKVNIVFGPQTYHRLPEFIARAQGAGVARNRVLDTDFPALEKFDSLPKPGLPGASGPPVEKLRL